MKADDLFNKLHTDTPQEEICKCLSTKPVKLMYALTQNPIHCIDCNLEVKPNTLGLNSTDINAIAYWRNVYGSIYMLWLDSGPYEVWAEKQLRDIRSPANVRGIELVNNLKIKTTCYFSYFQNESVDKFKPMQKCPNCGQLFEKYNLGIFPQYICKQCKIITVGE